MWSFTQDHNKQLPSKTTINHNIKQYYIWLNIFSFLHLILFQWYKRGEFKACIQLQRKERLYQFNEVPPTLLFDPMFGCRRKPLDSFGTSFTVMNRVYLEQQTSLLLDLGGLWAEHSTYGFIKHCLQTSLSKSRTLQVFYWIYFFGQCKTLWVSDWCQLFLL